MDNSTKQNGQGLAVPPDASAAAAPATGKVKRPRKLPPGSTDPRKIILTGMIIIALFFGGLLPMATAQGSMYLLPLLFGLGTALPVMAAGFLMSMGVSGFAARLGGIRSAEVWLRAITCTAFIGIGFYLTLSHVYHVI